MPAKFNIRFREATLSDLELLLHWDQQAHVIASDPDSDWEWKKELALKYSWREQLIAELDGRPIGMVQIIDPSEEVTHYWGAGIGPNKRAIDIWIGEAEDLGKGYGTVIMNLALERCFANPKVTEVLIDPLLSNVRAIQFYERIGFHLIEQRVFEGDECWVMQIRRTNWE